ncbi:Prominin-2 [Manis javanica]|nr:Prominin-2 [Manis javanica]
MGAQQEAGCNPGSLPKTHGSQAFPQHKAFQLEDVTQVLQSCFPVTGDLDNHVTVVVDYLLGITIYVKSVDGSRKALLLASKDPDLLSPVFLK